MGSKVVTELANPLTTGTEMAMANHHRPTRTQEQGQLCCSTQPHEQGQHHWTTKEQKLR